MQELIEELRRSGEFLGGVGLASQQRIGGEAL
jgi:hypothetical protein